MNAGIAAYVRLSQNTDVTNIVGVNIFPEVAEQETATPFIVYQLLSVAPEDTHDGPSTLDEVRFEFLCYADSYALAADLGSKVRGALDRVSGTYNGVNVESIQFNDVDIDTIDAPRRFAQVLTFTFRIKRDNFTIAQGTPVTGAKLGDLYDVDTTGVTDGQVIAYDAAAQEWQPADDAGGVTQLGQLTDVQFGQGGPESGDLLKYDGSEWTNDGLVKSEIGLGNVDNTSDASKPVSTATQTELNAKANSADFSNVDNTSDADKPVSTATQTALNAKADTSAVPTDLNDLSDVSIVGAPAGNQALIYDATAGAFKSQVSYTNRFEDEVETGINVIGNGIERAYSVKAEGDGIYLDASPDTPTAGKVIKRKIYHKTGFISDSDAIGDYTLIHTFADDTAYADTVAVFDAFEEGATYGVPPFTLFQTWEEVTAAPSFTGLLNETYGSGAAAAYSVRQLNGNYTGAAIQVERSSDNTYQDIGFDATGDLDESALTTFCTGTTCRVRTWYDQATAGGTGSGNDAVQTTHANQPTIYTGGAIVKVDGLPALKNDGADNMTLSTKLNLDDMLCVAHVNRGTVRDDGMSFGDNSVQTNFFWDRLDLQTTLRASNTNTTLTGSTVTGKKLYLLNRDNNSLSLRINSNETGTGSNSSTFDVGSIMTGYSGNGFDMHGDFQEFLFYDSSKLSTDRTSIESNIGDYFTQNTPLLDTYSGAAAAYSLRRLSSTYTGDAVEVYNGSSYADIGFNVFGELDTVALASHCGSNDGFVSKWYDQSGNTNDATQSTTSYQRKIYDSSTGVVTYNGKPAAFYSGSAGAYLHSTPSSTTWTSFAVTKIDGFAYGVHSRSAATGWWYLADGSGGSLSSGFTNVSLYKNGSAMTATTRAQLKTELGANHLLVTARGDRNTGGETWWLFSGYLENSGYNVKGYAQEAIIYDSDQSANRTNIEDNINTFYNIYS